MKSLLDTLYTYGSEHRVQAILCRYDWERWELEEELTRRLEEQRSALAGIYEQAAFLAGLSMGLELGALGQGT